MVDNEGAGPLAHVGACIVAGNCESGCRVNVSHEDTGDCNEAGQDHGSVAAEACSNRNEQSGCSTLGEEQCGNAEECESKQTRVLSQKDSSLFLNCRDVNTDNCGSEPADTENNDERFVTALEDGGVLDLAEFDVAEPVHQHGDEQHCDNNDVTGAECVADVLLEEEHSNDEYNGQEEDNNGELSTLGERSIAFFLGGHGDETGLQASLEDRVLFKVDTLEGGDQSSNSSTEETCREDNSESLTEGNAHGFNNDVHGGCSSGDRGCRNSDLGSNNSGCKRLRRTNAVLLSNFLNNVQDGHCCEASTGQDCQEEGESRSENVDVLRICTKNVTCNADHVVHTAGNVHNGAGEQNAHNDEDNVERHCTRGNTESEYGNSHTEAAGHTDADTAELSGVDDACEEQCKVNVYHEFSFG